MEACCIGVEHKQTGKSHGNLSGSDWPLYSGRKLSWIAAAPKAALVLWKTVKMESRRMGWAGKDDSDDRWTLCRVSGQSVWSVYADHFWECAYSRWDYSNTKKRAESDTDKIKWRYFGAGKLFAIWVWKAKIALEKEEKAARETGRKRK